MDRATILVHNGAMSTGINTVRQSVSLPAGVATQVRKLAKSRRLSANRMIVELIENGIEAEKRKQEEFFGLAEGGFLGLAEGDVLHGADHADDLVGIGREGGHAAGGEPA